MSVRFVVAGDVESEFRHFWGMVVRGFDPSRHCMACFVGTRYPQFKPGMSHHKRHRVSVDLEVKPGEYFYLCGVSHSFQHDRNFHMAGIVRPGCVSRKQTFGGCVVEAEGFEAVAINAGPAKKRYPNLGREFLTCRNFQFACQVFGEANHSRGLPSAQKLLF